jgi:hypothetical protein
MNSGLSPLAQSLAMDSSVVRQFCAFPEPARRRRRSETPITALAARYLDMGSPGIDAMRALAEAEEVKLTSLQHAVWRVRAARANQRQTKLQGASTLP